MTSMREAFAAVDFHPEAGSSLDQAALLDGDAVIKEYLKYGEVGLAFDHLLYLVEEPPLRVSQAVFDHLRAAAIDLGIQPSRLDAIHPS